MPRRGEGAAGSYDRARIAWAWLLRDPATAAAIPRDGPRVVDGIRVADAWPLELIRRFGVFFR